jgi:hypothetical protein
MSIFKVTGSILDVSGDVAAYVMNETRFIRAESAVLARLAFQRAFNGLADHVSLIGPNHSASVGSARIYDIATDTLDRQRPGMYRQTGRAIARCVAVKHARAETGASKAMAKAGRRIAEAQRRAGMPVRVKA